ncbi:MAG: (2Fe-2S)-binding protein [Rhodobacterales bacterium]|nr:(2Fe-2S)-binding protein [Rhodobacterales bacterium]
MFKRLVDIGTPVTFDFEGRPLTAQAGDSLASALLANGVLDFRQAPEDGTVRGPHCMIGNCFECLVEVEGLGTRQACRERVRDGLKVRRHSGRPVPGEQP